jgi:hypothetical protein
MAFNVSTLVATGGCGAVWSQGSDETLRPKSRADRISEIVSPKVMFNLDQCVVIAERFANEGWCCAERSGG